MISGGFTTLGLTARFGNGGRSRNRNRMMSANGGDQCTYRLYSEDGALLGTVPNVIGAPELGRNAPTVLLKRTRTKQHTVTGHASLRRGSKKRRFAMGLLVLAGVGCSSLPSELEPFDGRFEYVAFDADGEQVLQGQLVIDVSEDGTLTGSWDIDWIPGADRETPVGPQVGAGELVGAIAAGDLNIQLNPTNADNNVGLAGALAGSEITGEWQYVTFAGPTASGTFTATKR